MPEERVTSAARDLYNAGPEAHARQRHGARRLARRVLLRLTQPLSAYQRQLDLRLIEAVETLDVRRDAQEGRIAELAREIHGVLQALDGHQRRIDAIEEQAAATPYMEGHPFELQDRPVVGRALGYVGAAAHQSDSYAAFEDLFRGPDDRVRELQRVYVSVLDGRGPVLDLGCGRGEFLDLLREAAIEYRGVAADPGMVERARERGHDVIEADGIECLAGLPEASLGAIFSAQVIEHLPYDRLLELLRLAPLKLAPGGMLILETVNPHNPQALKTFWVDPTHKHPLFPEVMLALCKISGFESAHAFLPDGSGDYERDRSRHGAYAVVALRGRE
jgi:SAM-dependent methyltransferase